MWPSSRAFSDPDFASDGEIQDAVDTLVAQAKTNLSEVLGSEQQRLDAARTRLHDHLARLQQRRQRADAKNAAAQDRLKQRDLAFQPTREEQAEHEARAAGWKAIGVGSETSRLAGVFFRLFLAVLFFADLAIFVIAVSAALGTDPGDLLDWRNWVGVATGLLVFALGIMTGRRLKDATLKRRKARSAEDEADLQAQATRAGVDPDTINLLCAEYNQLCRQSGDVDILTWALGGLFAVFVGTAMYVRLVNLEVGDDPVINVLIGMVPILVMLFEYMAHDPHHRLARRPAGLVLAGLVARRRSWVAARALRREAVFQGTMSAQDAQLLEAGKLRIETARQRWEAAQEAFLGRISAIGGAANPGSIPSPKPDLH